MKINWKYAIGEILIVIIGITLAFSLNNWKESNTDKKQKKQYLENLIVDIEQEIGRLEKNQESIQGKLQEIGQIKPHLGKKQDDRDAIVRKIYGLARLVDFRPVNTTYQTLINSGDMKLINDFELRRTIEEHYALHKSVLKDYGRLEKIHENYLGDFFIYHIDYSELAKGNTDILDNPLIKNIITSIEGAYYLISQANKKCLESNHNLLEKIDSQL